MDVFSAGNMYLSDPCVPHVFLFKADIMTSTEEGDDPVTNNNMCLNDFKLMKIEALRDFLSLRKKSTDGDFETLVSR